MGELMLRRRLGDAPLAQDAVWRINVPPIIGFEADVGWRTDIDVVMSWPARAMVRARTERARLHRHEQLVLHRHDAWHIASAGGAERAWLRRGASGAHAGDKGVA